MIPEGLVLLMSLTFAVGAVRLSRKGMLVQYMNAIESLANVDTVCLDKTGTLTDGNLVLYGVDPLGGAAEDDVRALVSGYAASAEARNSTLDAVAAGLPGAAAASLEEVPFSSRWKWSGIRREDGWLVLGAPDVLLAGRLPAEVSGHEQEGRRVLAFGRADAGRVPGRWRWRHAPDRAAGAGGAGGAAARRRRRHDRLPLPPGRRREGDVGRLAGDGGGRRRPGRRPRGRHAQAGVRPARGSRSAGGRGARGDGVRAAHPRQQACPDRGADRPRRLRGHDRRRRQRRAGDEGGAAGGGPGQRHAAGQERRRQRAGGRSFRRHPRRRRRGPQDHQQRAARGQAVRHQVGVRRLRDRHVRAVDGRVPAAAAPPVAGRHVHGGRARLPAGAGAGRRHRPSRGASCAACCGSLCRPGRCWAPPR